VSINNLWFKDVDIVLLFTSLNFEKALNYIFICFSVLTDDPNFAEPIPNVTVSLGRDASLPCVVNNLGTYKVRYHVHIIIMIIIIIIMRWRRVKNHFMCVKCIF